MVGRASAARLKMDSPQPVKGSRQLGVHHHGHSPTGHPPPTMHMHMEGGRGSGRVIIPANSTQRGPLGHGEGPAWRKHQRARWWSQGEHGRRLALRALHPDMAARDLRWLAWWRSGQPQERLPQAAELWVAARVQALTAAMAGSHTGRAPPGVRSSVLIWDNLKG